MPTSETQAALLREQCEREDLVMFVNACFAATGQTEYYSDQYSQSVSIDFLHQYVLVNYRLVYARALAAGVNHFNQMLIVRNLLRAGAPSDSVQRAEEGGLIAATLRQLPTHRVYKLFQRLATEGVNNRRTRAVIRNYCAARKNQTFEAVKYRNKFRRAVRHAHAEVDGETASFLFSLKAQKRFQEPLFDAYRRAHYSKQAVYELPYSVAEGLAARHGIPRDVFLRNIEPQMTQAEKLRVQNLTRRETKQAVQFDLARSPLTRLAIYVLSLPMEERTSRADELHAALKSAAARTQRKSPLELGKVAAVLDRSRSAWGSRERRRRPLAVAVATHYLLAAASDRYCSFWTPAREIGKTCYQADDKVFLVNASGQSDLATPLLDAIEWRPEQLTLVSDGYENAPVDAVNQIVHAYRQRLAPAHPISFLHANPVFDADHFSPRRLGAAILTIGLRDAEDLNASLRFAKFAAGEATRVELESYLGDIAREFLQDATDQETQP
ncbi:hypothetical protein [Blastopirellula retiformator]|uniref:TROVE domain-containing protein n=1 Tax=Blastopirellula retiformator TaxID=2527970 RepID=A0A5C5UW87_9BACT|nr:hypothetical protein [Blastopirellula retiformator]TWT30644.1 hypothetical protein Enr8_41650 [Blastopirellula retiformator]